MATRQQYVDKINEIHDNHGVYVGGGNGEYTKDITFGKAYAMEKNYGRRDSNGKPLWGSDMRRDCVFIGKAYEAYGDEGMKNSRAVDCSGLEVAAFRDLGVIGPQDDYRARDFQKMSTKVALKDLKYGDFVFNKATESTHMGTYVGGGMVVESQGRDAGVVRRPTSEGGWVTGGSMDWWDEDVYTLYRILKYVEGDLMRGDDVAMVQEKLTKDGFLNDTIDGIYGKKTRDAVKKFQDFYNLSVDGIVGKNTATAMGFAWAG